ncbi:MAG: thioesterase [Clostridiaceae bacterium]|nr:thioesterase [Clostridiaceae bacterium]
MYTFESRVRYSEIAEDGKISLGAIIDYMQDCTNFQSEDLGVGLAYHKQRHLMWVLNSWQIVIDQYPEMGDRITVGTQAYGFNKLLGFRNFLITDASGARVAIANSNWVLVDTRSGSPVIVTPEIAGIYGTAEPLEMDYAPRKIKLPKESEKRDSILVREYHLDTNHHVNNRQYVQMAMEFLDRTDRVKELRVEYKKQAILGDEIVPMVYRTGENEKIIALNGTDGKAYAIVQFFLQ